MKRVSALFFTLNYHTAFNGVGTEVGQQFKTLRKSKLPLRQFLLYTVAMKVFKAANKFPIVNKRAMKECVQIC